MIKRITETLLFSMALASFGVAAHHSRATFFDMTKTVELEGEITRVQWRHPHVRYWMQADPAYGGEIWEMETTPPSMLERYGIGPDVLAAGTRVRVAGPPSKLEENVMEVSHVLLPDGREVLLHTGLPPRWSQDTIERELKAFSDEEIRAAEATANGIFRVWIRGPAGERPEFWLDDYPLTAAGQEVQAAWDPLVEVDTGCLPKGMPRTMGNSWPFEFVDEGDQIRLRIEEFDTTRIIHLTGEVPGDVAPSLLGYSTGRWEDGDLLVRTTNVDARYFGAAGIKLSGEAIIDERFILSADQRRLDYEMTVTDPVIFSEPVTQYSAWDWRPGETVKPYNCIDTPGSWSDSRD
jgi:hypothetical protein